MQNRCSRADLGPRRTDDLETLAHGRGGEGIDRNYRRPQVCGDYEEYHPHGSTAWWAGDSSTVSQKRYRYTGMEKDDETGLSYHHHRYYATWLGRWTSSDPIALKAGVNRYEYCNSHPTARRDRSGCAPPPSSGGVEPEEDTDSDQAPPDVDLDDSQGRQAVSAETPLGSDAIHDAGIITPVIGLATYVSPKVLMESVALFFGPGVSAMSSGGMTIPSDDFGPAGNSLVVKAGDVVLMRGALSLGQGAVRGLLTPPDNIRSISERVAPLTLYTAERSSKGRGLLGDANFAPTTAGKAAMRVGPVDPRDLQYAAASKRAGPAGAIQDGWKPVLDPNSPVVESGCANVASQVKQVLEGKGLRSDIHAIESLDLTGKVRLTGSAEGFPVHYANVSDGRVYDLFTGSDGMLIADYKAMWDNSSGINWTF